MNAKMPPEDRPAAPSLSATPAGPGVTGVTPSPTPRRMTSADIFRGQNAVEIDHAGQRYQLRVTRENKLILTK